MKKRHPRRIKDLVTWVSFWITGRFVICILWNSSMHVLFHKAVVVLTTWHSRCCMKKLGLSSLWSLTVSFSQNNLENNFGPWKCTALEWKWFHFIQWISFPICKFEVQILRPWKWKSGEESQLPVVTFTLLSPCDLMRFTKGPFLFCLKFWKKENMTAPTSGEKHLGYSKHL